MLKDYCCYIFKLIVWSHLLLHSLYFLLPVLAWRKGTSMTWMLTMLVMITEVIKRCALAGSVWIVTWIWHIVRAPVGSKAKNLYIGATIAGTNGMPKCIPCNSLPRALIHRRTQRCSSEHCLRDLDIFQLGLVGKWHQRSYRCHAHTCVHIGMTAILSLCGMHMGLTAIVSWQRLHRCAGVRSDCIAV